MIRRNNTLTTISHDLIIYTGTFLFNNDYKSLLDSSKTFKKLKKMYYIGILMLKNLNNWF